MGALALLTLFILINMVFLLQDLIYWSSVRYCGGPALHFWTTEDHHEEMRRFEL